MAACRLGRGGEEQGRRKAFEETSVRGWWCRSEAQPARPGGRGGGGGDMAEGLDSRTRVARLERMETWCEGDGKKEGASKAKLRGRAGI